MNIIEKRELIEEKEKELDKYKNYEVFDLRKFIIISVISYIISAIGGTISLVFYIRYGDNRLFYSIILCFLIAFIISCISIPTSIVFGIKKAKAPNVIEKLEEEISILENEISNTKTNIIKETKIIKETNEDKVSEMDKINLLIKYKELLDKNIITEEEFNKKKEELLK
jgi:hypothetical protein